MNNDLLYIRKMDGYVCNECGRYAWAWRLVEHVFNCSQANPSTGEMKSLGEK